MILMGDRFTVRFLVSGLSAERVKFGFLKDYAIRGKWFCDDWMHQGIFVSTSHRSRASVACSAVIPRQMVLQCSELCNKFSHDCLNVRSDQQKF